MAIISTNSPPLNRTDELTDRLLANTGFYGALFCTPTLLKDNYDTADMPTTGGNLYLTDSRSSAYAPAVNTLIHAGSLFWTNPICTNRVLKA